MSHKVQVTYFFLRKKLVYGALIRFVIQYSLKIYLSIFVNIRFLSQEMESKDYASSILAIVLLVTLIPLPYAFYFLVSRQDRTNPIWLERYGSLIKDLRV